MSVFSRVARPRILPAAPDRQMPRRMLPLAIRQAGRCCGCAFRSSRSAHPPELKAQAAEVKTERAENAEQKAQLKVAKAERLREETEEEIERLHGERVRQTDVLASLERSRKETLAQIALAEKTLGQVSAAVPSAAAAELQEAKASLGEARESASKPVSQTFAVPVAAGLSASVDALFAAEPSSRGRAYKKLTEPANRAAPRLAELLLAKGETKLAELETLRALPAPTPEQKAQMALLQRGLENVAVTLRDVSRGITFPVKDRVLALAGKLAGLDRGTAEEARSLQRWMQTVRR